jgi:hypothetical protein
MISSLASSSRLQQRAAWLWRAWLCCLSCGVSCAVAVGKIQHWAPVDQKPGPTSVRADSQLCTQAEYGYESESFYHLPRLSTHTFCVPCTPPLHLLFPPHRLAVFTLSRDPIALLIVMDIIQIYATAAGGIFLSSLLFICSLALSYSLPKSLSFAQRIPHTL